MATGRDHFNDFGAIMREKYLDDHGVTEYLNDQQLEEYEQTLKSSNIIDDKTIDYLTNPNSQYTYEELDWKNVSQALELLDDKDIPDASDKIDESGFRKDLSNRYVI